jgi:phage-related baseplate assembly protein
MSGFSAIDLTKLNAPDIIETLDFENIFNDMVAELKSRDNAFDALLESEPVIKVLEVAAYREVLLRARINDASKAVMLAYAKTSDLDNLAAYFGVQLHQGQGSPHQRLSLMG